MGKTNRARTVVAILIILGAVIESTCRRQSNPLAVGESAPDFTLRALGQGTVSLRDYRGQVVVVNFWATWCPPCVTEAPSLEKFAVEMRPRGVRVIGVTVDQDETALSKFVSAYHLSFPVARDPDRAVASRYGTSKFPESYILDRHGRVAEKIIGAIDWQDPRIISFVEELAGNPRQPAS